MGQSMLTFEFTTFWPEQQALKQECIDFMALSAGDADKVVVNLEDLVLSILF